MRSAIVKESSLRPFVSCSTELVFARKIPQTRSICKTVIRWRFTRSRLAGRRDLHHNDRITNLPSYGPINLHVAIFSSSGVVLFSLFMCLYYIFLSMVELSFGKWNNLLLLVMSLLRCWSVVVTTPIGCSPACEVLPGD